MSATPQLPLREGDVRARLVSATGLVGRLVGQISTLADGDLVGAAGDLEALGRHVDAMRVRVAGEVDARSDREGSGRASEDRLSTRFDCRNGIEVLERTTRASVRSLRTRVRLDRRTRTRTTLTGAARPAPFPAVSAALEAGELGMDAVSYLTDEFERLQRRGGVSGEEMEVAEREIVGAATHQSPGDDGAALPETFDEFRVMVDAWSAFLNRDGIEPDADYAEKYRGVSLGRARDGLVPLRGELVPEAAAGLQRLFDAYAGSTSTVRFGTSPEDAAEGAEWNPNDVIHDPRTATQKRHDVLLSMIQTSAASTETPSLGGAAPTLLVTTTVDDLDGGTATLDRSDVPVPASLAHRIACTGAVQKIIFDRAGRIVRLGTLERLFTAHQRRAIGVRDGGCIIPGCSIPAAWCEIHHVTEHSHGGATHTDNGVLLCWAHHHEIERSGWDIQMRSGVPYVKAPTWIDPRGLYRPVRGPATRRERYRRRRNASPSPQLPIPTN